MRKITCVKKLGILIIILQTPVYKENTNVKKC
jgi:hypothetical protein